VYLNISIPKANNTPEEVEAGKYDFDVESTSRGDNNADPEVMTFTMEVEAVYGCSIAELDEGATATAPKAWDVNDGKTLELKFTIENMGNTDDTFLIKKPTVPTGWTIDVSSLHQLIPIGDSKEMTVTIRFTQTNGFESGLQDLKFTIVPDDGSAAGNAQRKTVTIWVNAKAPELFIEDFNVPDDLSAGKSAKIEVVLRNAGTADADDVDVTLYDGTREVETVTENVRAGNTTTFSFTWKPTTGSHSLRVVIESGFIDADESNNEAKISRTLSKWDIQNYISFWTMFIILLILFILAAIVAAYIAYNRNREIRELEDLVVRLKEERGGAGGPRKVVKETAGAPMPPPGPAGLPSAPAPTAQPALKPADKTPRKEPVKVQCPKCRTVQVVQVEQRPAEVPCKECGVTLVISEKKK